jgi:DNA-binding MarR family transcriptional regulator
MTELTSSQFKLLLAITLKTQAVEARKISRSDLMLITGLSKSSITRGVKQLVGRGLIKRKINETGFFCYDATTYSLGVE